MKGRRPELAAWVLAAVGCRHVPAATTSLAPAQLVTERAELGRPDADADPSKYDAIGAADGLAEPAAEGSDSATLTIEPEAASEVAATEGSALPPRDSPDEPQPTYDAVFSEEDVERWEEQESSLAGPLALFGAVVLQKVRDYDRWRARFDEQIDAREQAGFVAQGVMRGVDDDQLIAVWLAVTDIAKAKAFFSSAWPKLGVRARVKLSRNLAAEIEPGRQGLSAALVTLKVQELSEFRAAFDATAPARGEAGLVGYWLGQDVDDEGIVYAYLQSEQPEALKAYLGSRETRRIWREASVVAIKNVTLVREGELMRCR